MSAPLGRIAAILSLVLATTSAAQALEPGLWSFHAVRRGSALGGLYSLDADKTAEVCLTSPSVVDAVRLLAEKNHCTVEVDGQETAAGAAMKGVCRQMGVAVPYALTASAPGGAQVAVVLTAQPNHWLVYSDHTSGRRIGDCPPAAPSQ